MKAIIKIDSCTVCPHEGTSDDENNMSMICTADEQKRNVGLEIPEWCPFGSSCMVGIDSLLTCLKHRHGSFMEKIGEYQVISDLADWVQKYTR